MSHTQVDTSRLRLMVQVFSAEFMHPLTSFLDILQQFAGYPHNILFYYSLDADTKIFSPWDCQYNCGLNGKVHLEPSINKFMGELQNITSIEESHIFQDPW